MSLTERAVLLHGDQEGSRGLDQSLAAIARRKLAAAATAGTIRGLDLATLTQLLKVFLASLQSTRDLIHAIAPALGDEADTVRTAGAATTLTKIARADALGITVPLLELITTNLINRCKSADLDPDDLSTAATAAAAVLAGINALADSTPAHTEKLRAAARALAGGTPAECDRRLAKIEDRLIRHAIDGDRRSTKFAIEIRSQRAAIQSLLGEYTKAARHFGFAQRYISPRQFAERWRYAAKEAANYELAALIDAAPQAMDHAARSLSELLAAIPPGTATPTRVRVQTSLARILLMLGERKHVDSHFDLAGQFLEDACKVFAENGDIADHIRAEALKAEAFCHLGKSYRIRHLLEKSATIFATLLTILSDPTTNETISRIDLPDVSIPILMARKALADLHLAHLEGNTTRGTAAIADILEALPASSPIWHRPCRRTSPTIRLLPNATKRLAPGMDSAANRTSPKAISGRPRCT